MKHNEEWKFLSFIVNSGARIIEHTASIGDIAGISPTESIGFGEGPLETIRERVRREIMEEYFEH